MPCGSFHLHFGTCLIERRAHCYSALTGPQVLGSQSLVSPVPFPAFRWVRGSDLESLGLGRSQVANTSISMLTTIFQHHTRPQSNSPSFS